MKALLFNKIFGLVGITIKKKIDHVIISSHEVIMTDNGLEIIPIADTNKQAGYWVLNIFKWQIRLTKDEKYRGYINSNWYNGKFNPKY
jgi:NADH:ubiquinone oxidoreductase subunit K